MNRILLALIPVLGQTHYGSQPTCPAQPPYYALVNDTPSSGPLVIIKKSLAIGKEVR